MNLRLMTPVNSLNNPPFETQDAPLFKWDLALVGAGFPRPLSIGNTPIYGEILT